LTEESAAQIDPAAVSATLKKFLNTASKLGLLVR
jgi:hypothetical protein